MHRMRRLLLIDDDERLGPPLAAYFARFDFELQHATRPSAGLARLRAGGFDAAILDVMLPEMDGFELCRTIRKRQRHPDRDADRARRRDGPRRRPRTRRRRLPAQALRAARAAGARADHPAPRAPRAASDVARQLRFDGLDIDLDRRSVQRQGEPVELTGTEFELLALLAAAPHKVFSRDDILDQTARPRGRRHPHAARSTSW